MSRSYTQIILSKTSKKIPLKGEISVSSRYDPAKEADSFASQYSQSDLFFVIGGLCGGYHIWSLLSKNTYRKIIVVEQSEEDFEFLMDIDCCRKLSKDRRVIFSTPGTLFRRILDNYLPAVHGKLIVDGLRGWKNASINTAAEIKAVTEKALESERADFAAQSRFGKIWQKNIFENLGLSQGQSSVHDILSTLDTETKTAAVIAAGPSLDTSIKKLDKFRKDYFIIATDTALPALIKSGIMPDTAVSIDGQQISHCHFLGMKGAIKSVLFLLDLCSDSSSARKIAELGGRFVFFTSGHPLAMAAAEYAGPNFISLSAGAGTVTIAAADFACKAGFSKVEFFGADFSYPGGKPYARGTYLDTIYGKDQTRLSTAETRFSALMYRTKLINTDGNAATTEVLDSYRKSLEYFLRDRNAVSFPSLNKFNIEGFRAFLRESIKSLPENIYEAQDKKIFYALLPLIAYYETKSPAAESYELACANSLRYT